MISNNSGFVYVLDGKVFSSEGDSEGWQVKSKKTVKPVKAIKVSFDDFEKLGGKVVWKEEV